MAALWLELYDGIGSCVWLVRLRGVKSGKASGCASSRLEEKVTRDVITEIRSESVPLLPATAAAILQ